MKPKEPKRHLKFVYDDGTSFSIEVTKFTTLRKDVPHVMLHVDRLQDGSHLMILNESLIPMDDKRQPTAKLDRIEVIRDL